MRLTPQPTTKHQRTVGAHMQMLVLHGSNRKATRQWYHAQPETDERTIETDYTSARSHGVHVSPAWELRCLGYRCKIWNPSVASLHLGCYVQTARAPKRHWGCPAGTRSCRHMQCNEPIRIQSTLIQSSQALRQTATVWYLPTLPNTRNGLPKP